MKDGKPVYKRVNTVALAGSKFEHLPCEKCSFPPARLGKTSPRISLIASIREPLRVNNSILVGEREEEDFILGFWWDSKAKMLKHGSLDSDNKPIVKELANFEITFREKIVTIRRDGKEVAYTFTIDDGYKKQFGKVSEKELKVFPKAYLTVNPSYYWLNGNENLAKKYLAEKFKAFDAPNSVKYVYDFAGWYKLAGKYLYMNDQVTGCISDVKVIADPSMARTFLHLFLEAVNPSKGIMLLTFASYGYLARLVQEASLPGCNAVLQIVGASGVGKTAITKILAKGIFTDDNLIPVLRYNDTKAFLENKMKRYQDIFWLLDDWYVSSTSNEAKQLAENANLIARLAGDQTHRGKCGKGREAEDQEPFFGSIASTAEQIDLPSYSSYARSIVLNFSEGDVIFGESLTALQQNSTLASSFFSCLIKYVELKQSNWLGDLPNKFKKYVSVLQNAGASQKRLVASAASLLCIAELIVEVARAVGYEFSVDVISVLSAMLITHEKRLVEAKPEKIVSQALVYALETMKLKLCSNEAEFKYTASDGFFMTDEKVIIISSRVDDIMAEYSQKKHVAVPWKTPGLKDRLVEIGVIIARNGKYVSKYSKNRAVNLPRSNVIWFSLKKLEETAGY